MKNTDYSSVLNLSPDEMFKRQKTTGWALSFVGLVVYCVLRLLRFQPKSYHGICKYFEIGENWGGLEMGWFFICGRQTSERTKNHEVGHNIQNATVGGLTMLFLCIASAFRYWKRKLFGAKDTYDSWWFEGQATLIGTEYVNAIKERTENEHK